MLGRKCQEHRATGGWPEPWERPGATLEQEDRGANDPEDVWGGVGEAQGPTGHSNQGDGSVHAHHGLALHPLPGPVGEVTLRSFLCREQSKPRRGDESGGPSGLSPSRPLLLVDDIGGGRGTGV